jgi:hypothetical protein
MIHINNIIIAMTEWNENESLSTATVKGLAFILKVAVDG